MKKKEISVERVLGATIVSSNVVLRCTKYNLKPFSENRYGGFEEQEEFVTEKEKKDFRNHVNRIKESMVAFGKLLGSSEAVFDDREPIIIVCINGVNLIIDGQHRYAAAKELGIPYYAIVVQSNLVDSKGNNLSNGYDYAKELFNRLNDNKIVGGSKKWSTYNQISAAARGGNKVAIHICELCNSNPLFDASVINYKNGEYVSCKGKKGRGSKVGAYELVENYGRKDCTEINKRIDNFARICKKIAENSFDNYTFKSDEERMKKYRSLIKADRFTSAVQTVIKRNIPLSHIITNAKFNSTGIISKASAKDYLLSWGVID